LALLLRQWDECGYLGFSGPESIRSRSMPLCRLGLASFGFMNFADLDVEAWWGKLSHYFKTLKLRT
jgi:hypothetical protein